MEIAIGFLLGSISTGTLWLILQIMRVDPYPPLQDVSLPKELPGGLRAYSCTKWRGGLAYGVVLYGRSASEILRDHPDVQIEGLYEGELQ